MKGLQDLSPHAGELLERSVAWMDRYWDEAHGLLWAMPEVVGPDSSECGAFEGQPYHLVRESTWYALGLLVRGRPGDAARALHALDAVLAWQFDEPGKVYHGTFYRAPEEPHPPEPAIEWKHYDPNWREFIITTIAVILSEFEAVLPPALLARIDVAIRKAVEGALARGLSPRYTNIALMDAQMLVYAGDRLGEPPWVEAGEQMAREVSRLFAEHGAFEEYNSPTYYGVDIYGLRLWQAYCSSPEMNRMGAEIEAALWHDIAQFYHAGLRNIAGPYDRSYGMDMCRYVALLGEWIWLTTGQAAAPFPHPGGSFAHAADFCFGPLVAILDAPSGVPAGAAQHLTAFLGERSVAHVLGDSPPRSATAWLGEQVMIGAEHTSGHGSPQGQFHPATIHWRLPGGGRTGCPGVGWIRLLRAPGVDVVASPWRLAVSGRQELAFLIDSGESDAAAAAPDVWRLPGLEVRVETTTAGAVEKVGERMLVTYRAKAGDGEVRVVLDLTPGA